VNRIFVVIVSVSCVALFQAQLSSAQAHRPTLGDSPFQSKSGSDFEHVNVENGGLVVHIPLVSLAQRGKLNMSFSITGNGSQYQQSSYCDSDGNCEYGYTHYNPCMEPNTYLGDDGSADLGFIWDQPHSICGMHHLTRTNAGGFWGDPATGFTSAVIDEFTDGTQDLTVGLPDDPGEGGDTYQEWNEYKLLDSDGASHVFGYDQTDYSRLKTNDGTGFVLDLEGPRTTIEASFAPPGNSYSILSPDGIRERFTRSGATVSEDMTMSDPSGNSIVWNYTDGLVDSIGRRIDYVQSQNAGSSTAGCPTIAGQPAPDSSQFWRVRNAGGVELLKYQLCYASVSIHTNFFDWNGESTHWCRYDADSAGDPTTECFYYDETTSTDEKLQSVVLPNGTFWGFSYTQPDANGINYGDLSAIRLPSGGEVRYAYANVAGCGDTSGEAEAPLGHVLVNRTMVPLVGPNQSINYSYLPLRSNSEPDQVIESDDAGNEVVHSLYGYSYDSPCSVADSDTKYYQGSHQTGALIKEIVRNYTSVQTAQKFRFDPIPAYTGTGSTDRILNFETTYLDGILASQKSYQYDNWFTDVQPLADIDGSGGEHLSLHPVQPTIVLLNATSASDGVRTVVTKRLAKDNPTYALAGLLNIPAEESILDDQNNPVAKTVFGYDEVGSPQGVYGNNTSKRDVSLTSGVPDSLTTTTYNTNGMPVASIDARGNAGEAGNHTTALTYDATGIFVSRLDRPTTNGQPHTSYYGTDPTLGVLLWESDENASGPGDPAHTTTYAYDLIGRATGSSFPGGGSTQVCFSDETLTGCSAASSAPPYAVEVTVQTGTSAGPQVRRSEFDGLGRILSRIVAPRTSITSSVDTVYDSEGHVYSVSNPHGSTAGPTDGLTIFTYDALGRKRLQTNPDTTTLQWNYSGNTVTSRDEIGNGWQHTSDVTGRLVQVVEPGGPQYNV